MIKTSERERLQERREQVVRDLEELSEQIEDDQLDRATADRLHAVYAEELADIDETIAGLGDEPVEETESADEEVRVRGFSYGTVAIASLTLMLLTGLIIWAGSRPAPDDAESAASSPGATVDAGAIDIEGMSTEELL
ncbi:MAG: hypothetical protein M3132_04905, partial [Actinomycetia bacterium]|nr:hypothetical protein [Actinomycetes bacterium]